MTRLPSNIDTRTTNVVVIEFPGDDPPLSQSLEVRAVYSKNKHTARRLKEELSTLLEGTGAQVEVRKENLIDYGTYVMGKVPVGHPTKTEAEQKSYEEALDRKRTEWEKMGLTQAEIKVLTQAWHRNDI